MYLLNWRICLAVILIALYPIGYMKGRIDGGKVVRNEWKAAVSEANLEARKMEQLRQRNVDQAAVLATQRQGVIAADAARADDALDGLRDSLAARDLAEESLAAAVKRANTAEQLLIQGGEALRAMAQSCDRHVNDLRLLLEAWPK